MTAPADRQPLSEKHAWALPDGFEDIDLDVIYDTLEQAYEKDRDSEFGYWPYVWAALIHQQNEIDHWTESAKTARRQLDEWGAVIDQVVGLAAAYGLDALNVRTPEDVTNLWGSLVVIIAEAEGARFDEKLRQLNSGAKLLRPKIEELVAERDRLRAAMDAHQLEKLLNILDTQKLLRDVAFAAAGYVNARHSGRSVDEGAALNHLVDTLNKLAEAEHD